MDLSYVLILGFAVSIDGFFAGIAYGIKQIKIPVLSLLSIGFVTLACTGFSCFGARFLQRYFDPPLMAAAGALMLIALGLAGVSRQYFSRLSASPADDGAQGRVKISLGKIVVYIMAKPERADMDQSSRLSVAEALLLGLALGVDNMAATFAAGLVEALPVYTPPVMCVIQAVLVYGGICSARKVTSAKMKARLAYAPGLILILIGISRFL